MKILPCLFLALAFSAASVIACSSSFADTPQTANLTIENHQKLVTVKDGNGSWQFAQVITTPDVKVSQVSLGANLSRVSLQDATGKILWSKTVNTPVREVNAHGEWSDKFQADLSRAADSLGWKDSHTESYANMNRIESVVGSDDRLVTCRIFAKKHTFKIAPIKNGIAFEADDNKTVIILQPPALPAAPAVAQALTP